MQDSYPIFMPSMKDNRNIRTLTYLALGDSYTIGEKVAAEDNFPNQVVKLLNDAGFDFEPPVIIANTGWTTDELAEAIQKAELKSHYDFVTLLIGVNDQYRGRPVVDYRPGFGGLLEKAIALAGDDPSHVIVLSIPDWGATPFAEGRNRAEIAQEIERYNMISQDIAVAKKVHYLNITPGTRSSALQDGMLAEDGLHPSGKEYELWAKQVAALIMQVL